MDNLNNKDSTEAPAICTEYKGLVNSSNNCFRNSIIQSLFMTPEFKNLLYKCDVNYYSANMTIVQMKKLFLKLQDPSNETVEWKSNGRMKQGDAQEFFVNILKSFQEELKTICHFNFINIFQDLLTGQIINCIKCNVCKTEKLQEETFLDISLPIHHSRSTKVYTSLIDALKGFTEIEILDGDNQYFCNCCKKNCNAEKVLKFSELPYILTICLKRFKFNYQTTNYIKLSDEIQFPLEININSFKFKESSVKRKVKEGDSENLSHASNKYHLYVIIIHTGDYNGGHYYAFIKDFKTNQWLKFNDDSVTVTSMEHIIKISDGVKTTVKEIAKEIPYILMYRKTDDNKNENSLEFKEFPPHLKEFYNLLMKEEEKTAGRRNKRKRKS
ncbi:Peptidase C19, ubiquitin carboxyl-terminal hydrolase,Ubiquitin specific protease domain [Cinara cedri]|uniref:Peptidase C19, ubiquitin carboxyl-terminal hydrolase,Ubiquitin specific protease domain n=1 Tax=Cinara cedri TaxID=506608 RepID=A0A5E4M3I8_9HEMI|nr:Peptidase C19, ubiquitin carboxyl-terminal hydrolase,Ubiquitin specific protease domain [Cinara cedri]